MSEQALITERPVRLGLRENRAQFSLLVAVTAFVGAMVGLERSTLPLIGRQDFGLASSATVLSFSRPIRGSRRSRGRSPPGGPSVPG